MGNTTSPPSLCLSAANMRGCSRLQVDLVRVVCTAVLLFADGQARPQEQDAWLAVINGQNSALPGPQPQERVDVSQQQQQQQQQPEVRQNQRPQQGQPLPGGRPVARRPLPPPPPPQGPGVRPFQGGPPPPPLRRGPPPPRPAPAKKDGGILGTISEGLGNILNPVSCAATNVITDNQLKDEKFIRSQMNCAKGTGPCDQIGKQIKILAPEVLAGRCPHPCNECIKKQIRKVMAELSQRYPREFQEMMGQFRRLKG